VNESSDPAAVVQRQLDAYNARNVEGLLATYADDTRDPPNCARVSRNDSSSRTRTPICSAGL
jgi:hypothetical protein